MYPKSIYKNHLQAVVFCGEEHAARLADGWSDFKPSSVNEPGQTEALIQEIRRAGQEDFAADRPIATDPDTASTPAKPDDEAPPPPVVQKRKKA